MSFKIGDRVRYLRRSMGAGTAGLEGTIIKPPAGRGQVQGIVRVSLPKQFVNDYRISDRGCEFWAHSCDLELIPEQPTICADPREYLAVVAGGIQ